jgi:iron complex transport system permease protein
MLTSLVTGSVELSVAEVLEALRGTADPSNQQIIRELRLPRTLNAFTVGAMLAVAGALMQVILRNPLADPYILGISGGAAVAALLAILAGVSGAIISASAFAGALVSVVLVFALAHGSGSWTPTRVLLTGVVLAAGWGALVSLILTLSPDQNLKGMLFWLMGDLSYPQQPGWAALVLAACTLVAMAHARPLNLLLHGPLQASALGVSVNYMYTLIFCVAALLTATAVSMAGSIGFIGLIVPHLVRLTIGSDHRLLLPASMLLGGCLLVAADTLARTIISPLQLPTGIVTAFIGVPMFLVILHRGARSL